MKIYSKIKYEIYFTPFEKTKYYFKKIYLLNT